MPGKRLTSIPRNNTNINSLYNSKYDRTVKEASRHRDERQIKLDRDKTPPCDSTKRAGLDGEPGEFLEARKLKLAKSASKLMKILNIDKNGNDEQEEKKPSYRDEISEFCPDRGTAKRPGGSRRIGGSKKDIPKDCKDIIGLCKYDNKQREGRASYNDGGRGYGRESGDDVRSWFRGEGSNRSRDYEKVAGGGGYDGGMCEGQYSGLGDRARSVNEKKSYLEKKLRDFEKKMENYAKV